MRRSLSSIIKAAEFSVTIGKYNHSGLVISYKPSYPHWLFIGIIFSYNQNT